MTFHYHLVREQEQSSLSRTHHGEHNFTTESSDQTVADLVDIVREQIESLEESKPCGPKVEDIEIRIYEHPKSFTRKQLETGSRVARVLRNVCPLKEETCLDKLSYPENLIVVFDVILRFHFALFQKESLSRTYIGSGSVVVSHKDTVEVIEEAARGYITNYLSKEFDPAVEAELTGVKVYEPNESYKEAYNTTLEKMADLNLNGDQLTRQGGLTSLLLSQSPIDNIKGTNLIVEFSIIRKLSLGYVLFEHKSQVYQYSAFNSVEATSKDTVKFIEDTIRTSFKREVEVCVYEPRETFRAAYDRDVRDLTTLALTDESLGPKTAVKLPSSYKLSSVRAGQTLIITFRMENGSTTPTREKIAQLVRGRPPPSRAAKCSNLRTIQNPNHLDAVYNNRPSELSGPPIQIYHPAFAAFIRELFDTTTTITPATLDMARELIDVSLRFYEDELQRRAELERLEFWRSVLSIEYVLGKTVIRPDGSITVHPPGGHQTPIQIIELKNEVGEGGSDPIMQAERSYTSIFCSPGYELTCRTSCCPAILVGIAGPHLTVAGAIFGDRLTTQRLTDYVYLGPHPSREGRAGLDEGIRRVARILHALEVSTKLLKDHYLVPNPGIERVDGELMPPHFQEFTADGKAYKLKYVKRMAAEDPEKAVFEASMEDRNQPGESSVVVVKFAHSYCKAAHSLLAGMSLAPHVRYCEKVESVGMYVVIMDLVIGNYVEAPYQDQRFADKLRTAIQTLHDANFVHGDLREPNVLITEDGDMKIIDFDWCGKEGEVHYPSDINLGKGVGWDSDVVCGGLIKKDHDLSMFVRLTGLKWPEGGEGA